MAYGISYTSPRGSTIILDNFLPVEILKSLRMSCYDYNNFQVGSWPDFPDAKYRSHNVINLPEFKGVDLYPDVSSIEGSQFGEMASSRYKILWDKTAGTLTGWSYFVTNPDFGDYTIFTLNLLRRV